MGNMILWLETGPPVGTIVPFAGSTPPDGWLLCDGSAVSRTKYSRLFSVIGTTYGAGDGSTTFNLPNLKGKVVVGIDVDDTDFNVLGKTGGEKRHVLTVSELPSHNHSISSDGAHTHSISSDGSHYHSYSATVSAHIGDIASGFGATNITAYTSAAGAHSHGGATGSAGSHSHGGTTESVGSDAAHNNLQPYIVLNFIIKY